MTLYLFSRPARPHIEDNCLKLYFKQSESIHLIEMSKTESIRTLRDIAFKVCGQKLNVEALAEQPAQPETRSSKSEEASWIEKVVTTGKELGIPVKLED